MDAVERQVEAYNARDAEAFAACYAEHVEVLNAEGAALLLGRDALRDEYAPFFAASPDLHVEVTNRIRLGRFVIDQEFVTGRPGPDLRAVAIYRLDDDGLIDRVQFLT